MRLAEDLAVSNATYHGEERLDLILGGHDHEVVCRFAGDSDQNPEVILQGQVNDNIVTKGQVASVEGDVRIVKSGTDWRGYSVVRLVVGRHEDGKAYVQIVKCKPPARCLITF
jgi:2',3'-cyclic-nucleotide 2'-phosphodiesterase (5'-nucleotidase family)